MTVSELARNASGRPWRAAIPDPVLSDFKGLRRHFRTSRIAYPNAAPASAGGEGQAAQARPWAPRGRPSLAAIVSATSARLARAPIGPAAAPAPKARIGTCSRV
jgi:hypothetical protein